MKTIKGVGLLVMLLITAQFTQIVNALPAGDKSVYDELANVSFSLGVGSAEADCKVYEYSSGAYTNKYIYAYKISNVDSGIGLSFFSVGILDGATAYDLSYDALPGAVDPANWATVVQSPSPQVLSVNASFSNAIGDGFSSVWLWFASDYAPTSGKASLFGTSSAIPYFATADLLTPVPEPATLALFAIGGLAALRRRIRRN